MWNLHQALVVLALYPYEPIGAQPTVEGQPSTSHSSSTGANFECGHHGIIDTRSWCINDAKGHTVTVDGESVKVPVIPFDRLPEVLPILKHEVEEVSAKANHKGGKRKYRRMDECLLNPAEMMWVLVSTPDQISTRHDLTLHRYN